jgi:uncharacterized protein YndB with AHSA1/START domain
VSQLQDILFRTLADPTRRALFERLCREGEKTVGALTQPHLIAEWLMQNDFKPVAGHRFTLRRQPKPEVNVVIDCEVLEVEPHKTLTYTWQAFGLDSVVTWTLTPTPNGTRLTMVQTGFRPDQETAYRGAKAAWRQFFAGLEQLVARLD